MKHVLSAGTLLAFPALFLLLLTCCGGDGDGGGSGAGGGGTGTVGNVVFLVIGEDSIDNGNPPNNFSAVDVNDQLAAIGLRAPLRWFQENVGRTIDPYTGQVGDEGWFALKIVPPANPEVPQLTKVS